MAMELVYLPLVMRLLLPHFTPFLPSQQLRKMWTYLECLSGNTPTKGCFDEKSNIFGTCSPIIPLYEDL